MTPTKSGRNAALAARRAGGATKADLAREFAISAARVDQLLARHARPAKAGPVRPVTDGERDYPSAAAAARAHGTTRQRAWDRAHFRVRGWRFLGPAAVAAALLLVAVPAPASAQDEPGTSAPDPHPCGRLSALVAALSSRFGEAPVVSGISDKGDLLVLFESSGGGTWTAARVTPSGVACVIATGHDLTGAGKTSVEKGDPS